MTRDPWTLAEIRTLTEHAHQGAHVIAQITGRSLASVKAAAHRHRISLRRRHERRGKVLGEPRTATGDLLPGRVAVLDRDLDGRRLDYHLEQAAARRRGERRPTCPACGTRAIEMPSTGLCRTCHRHAAIEAYRHAHAEQAAEREAVSERQRRHRSTEPAGASDGD